MEAQSKTGDEKLLTRIPELDGIRGIAILLVLIWHYGVSLVKVESDSLASYFMNALGLTWSGVDLFFVLSGFLIGGILIDNKEATNYFKVFYVRRVCRIFPLYFLWLLLFIVFILGVQALVPSVSSTWLFENPLPLWSYATFTQNMTMAQQGSLGPHWLAITWSLAVEEQFYLLLPFIVRFFTMKKMPYVIVCLILVAPILRLILYYSHSHAGLSTYVLMPCRADALLLGVICAYMVRQKRLKQYLSNHTKYLYLILIVFLLLLVIITIKDQMLVSFGRILYGYSLLALLYTCFLLIAVTEKQGIVTRVTRNPLLRYLGLLAYGVYMFHQGINGLCHGLILQQVPQIQTTLDLLVTIGALCLTLFLATLSWFFFEKRVLALGHSLKYSNTRPIKVAAKSATGALC